MTPDERTDMQLLHDNIKLLHEDMLQFYAELKRQDARERKTRAALGAAISAYLESLVDNGAENK